MGLYNREGGTRVKLLFAEDEYYTRKGISATFPWKENGIDELIVASDGRQATELLAQKPDILLTDIRMPFVDGVTLAGTARNMDPAISILMLTSYSDKEYLKAAISLSILAYMEKPVDMRELAENIALAREKRVQNLRLLRMEAQEKLALPYPPECAHQHQVQSALRYMHAHYEEEDLSLERIAEETHLTPDYLSSLFREDIGINPKRVLTEIRLTCAKKLLRDTEESVQEIAQKVGYASGNYFAKLFRRETGTTPSDFREGREET